MKKLEYRGYIAGIATWLMEILMIKCEGRVTIRKIYQNLILKEILE